VLAFGQKIIVPLLIITSNFFSATSFPQTPDIDTTAMQKFCRLLTEKINQEGLPTQLKDQVNQGLITVTCNTIENERAIQLRYFGPIGELAIIAKSDRITELYFNLSIATGNGSSNIKISYRADLDRLKNLLNIWREAESPAIPTGWNSQPNETASWQQIYRRVAVISPSMGDRSLPERALTTLMLLRLANSLKAWIDVAQDDSLEAILRAWNLVRPSAVTSWRNTILDPNFMILPVDEDWFLVAQSINHQEKSELVRLFPLTSGSDFPSGTGFSNAITHLLDPQRLIEGEENGDDPLRLVAQTTLLPEAAAAKWQSLAKKPYEMDHIIGEIQYHPAVHYRIDLPISGTITIRTVYIKNLAADGLADYQQLKLAEEGVEVDFIAPRVNADLKTTKLYLIEKLKFLLLSTQCILTDNDLLDPKGDEIAKLKKTTEQLCKLLPSLEGWLRFHFKF
jgi:hypothetical protein